MEILYILEFGGVCIKRMVYVYEDVSCWEWGNNYK